MTKNLTPSAPHSTDAEAAVLSALLLDPSLVDDVADILEANHFYETPHQIVFQTILDLHQDQKTIDVVTVAHLLRAREQEKRIGGTNYLGELVDSTPAVANVRAHAEIVFDMWRLRNLIKVTRRISVEGYSATESVGEFLDKSEAEVFAACARRRQGDGLVHIRPVVENLVRDIASPDSPGIPSGFANFDRVTQGWHPGDLVILAARPGMGKSVLAGDFARNLVDADHHAALFSLEMPKEQLASRLLCGIGGIQLSRIRSRKLDAVDWQNMTDAATALTTRPLFIDDTPAQTVAGIRAESRRAAAEAKRKGKRLAAVIIDYLQLMSQRGAQSREQEIAAITRGLKILARELDCVVIALSQLNREAEKRKSNVPQLSDLRESGSIEQDADVVLFLYREDYYRKDRNTGEEMDNRADLIVAKQRNGPLGPVGLKFYPRSTTFRDDPDWQENRH